MPQLKLSLCEIEEAILHLKKDEQLRLREKLPTILQLSANDFASLELAEPSFRFWDNPEDEVYDSL